MPHCLHVALYLIRTPHYFLPFLSHMSLVSPPNRFLVPHGHLEKVEKFNVWYWVSSGEILQRGCLTSKSEESYCFGSVSLSCFGNVFSLFWVVPFHLCHGAVTFSETSDLILKNISVAKAIRETHFLKTKQSKTKTSPYAPYLLKLIIWGNAEALKNVQYSFHCSALAFREVSCFLGLGFLFIHLFLFSVWSTTAVTEW